MNETGHFTYWCGVYELAAQIEYYDSAHKSALTSVELELILDGA